MLICKKKGYFGRVLKNIRIKKGLLLKDIAECLGKSIPYISDVEKGNRNPLSIDSILKISLFFNIPEAILIKAAVVEHGAIILPIYLLSHEEIDSYIVSIVNAVKSKRLNDSQKETP